MDDSEIQNIGVKKKTLKEAESLHYECMPSHWQMFEVLVSFCKDCPDDFNKWKKNKLEKIREKWQKEKSKK